MNIFQNLDEIIVELESIEAKPNSKVEIALNRLRKVRVILNQAADEEAAALQKTSIGVPDDAPDETENPVDDAPDETENPVDDAPDEADAPDPTPETVSETPVSETPIADSQNTSPDLDATQTQADNTGKVDEASTFTGEDEVADSSPGGAWPSRDK